MRALEFRRDHVTFKLPYDFSYHMKTPYVMMSRNITKRCWQYLTPGFDKMILKICRKLKFHDGFFSCQLNKKANSARLAAKKIHCGILISFIFLKSSHQVDMKNIVKSSKNFFGYFSTYSRNSQWSLTILCCCWCIWNLGWGLLITF